MEILHAPILHGRAIFAASHMIYLNTSIYFSRFMDVLRFIRLIVWIAEAAPGAKYTKADLAKAVMT